MDKDIEKRSLELVKLIKENKDNKFLLNEYVDTLYKANEGLINKIFNLYNIDRDYFDDYKSEAYNTIYECSLTYDFTMNTKFTTYLYNSLENQIIDLINNSSFLSFYMKKKIRIIDDFIEKYYEEHKCYPDIDTISNSLNIQPNKINEYISYKYINKTIEEDSRRLSNEVEDNILFSERLKRIKQSFDSLDDRERDIISLKLGLNGEKPLTFKKISNKYDMSAEGVRQIYNRTLEKMKNQMEK
ncbi:MAG: sigma-70 family RNA polymerase sigma factor [Gammaproteobacteria bacterium]|nr:sigma-70 family RNA polymerase sigma factor [Gammaproteobacteria bacterium]